MQLGRSFINVFRVVVPSLIACALPCAGCSAPREVRPAVLAVPASQPIAVMPIASVTSIKPVKSLPVLLLHLPGIGGVRNLDRGMTRGLQQGGFTGEVQFYDWTGEDAGLKSLLGLVRNKHQAKIVAEKLTERFDADPAARIIITSHSGGAGIAVWALEDLPDRVKIDTLLMLAPALSPKYDLSKALRHVSGRLYVFSSLDDPVLGFGCRLLGTIDGVKTDAAGRVGFDPPPGADAGQYAKLVSEPYDRSWVYLDNTGDHIGPMTRKFARVALAPLLMTGTLPTTQPLTAKGVTQ